MANDRENFEKQARDLMRPVEDLIAQASAAGWHVQVAASLNISGKAATSVSVNRR